MAATEIRYHCIVVNRGLEKTKFLRPHASAEVKKRKGDIQALNILWCSTKLHNTSPVLDEEYHFCPELVKTGVTAIRTAVYRRLQQRGWLLLHDVCGDIVRLVGMLGHIEVCYEQWVTKC